MRQLVDPALAKAASHPLRMRILALLEQGDASPLQISRAVDQPLNTVSYHVRVLADLGFIELASTANRRGAVEHTYRLTARWAIADEAWSQLPQPAKAGVTGAILRQIMREDIGAASFSRGRDVLVRTQVQVDTRGRQELEELLAGVVDQVAAIEQRAVERLAGRSGQSEEVVVMFFQPKL